MNLNWIAVIGAALVPMITGFIWYHPKVFGTAWMKASGVTEEQTKTGNMPLIFGVSIFLSLLLALMLIAITIHQSHVMSLLQGNADEAVSNAARDFLALVGDRFRTFKHGALHGALAGIFIVLPVLGTNALFERKGWKYILLNVGYWILTLTLMGGIICQWAIPVN